MLDYYLLLPRTRYFAVGTRQNRLDLINPAFGGITDIRNGYLKTRSDGAQEELTVCLFKHPDRTDLLAAGWNYASDGVWEPRLDFYRYEKGHLVDVTRKTVPMRSEAYFGFVLPRHGTTIHVIDQAGRKHFDWIWRGGRFKAIRRAR